MLKLHFKDNRQAPVWLVEERVTLGRDRRNQVHLEEAQVSAFHAEIRQEEGLYFVTDCDSEQGTFVNDERVASRYQLRHGDCLRLGSVELLLSDPNRAAAREAGGQRWFLQVMQGEHEGKKFHLSGSMTFGRSAKCELCFSDAQLSRRHCEFFVKDDVLEVKDLASANGMLVNGVKTAAAQLKPGDQLRMGSVTLLVIGPKVDSTQADEVDEDATLFVRAADLPLPKAARPRPGVAAAPTINPLHAAAQAQTGAAMANAGGGALRIAGLAVGLLLIVGVGLAFIL